MSAQAEKMRRLYSNQGPIYDRTRWAFLLGRRRANRLLEAQPGECILDLGCGTGRWLPELAHKVGPEGRIIGIDCVSTLLDRARRRCRQLPWVRLVEGDFLAEAKQLPGIDAAIVSYSLSMMVDWQANLRELQGLLSPGGRVVAVDFLRCSTPGLAQLFRAHGVHFGAERREELRTEFDLQLDEERRAYGAAWSWYLLAGARCAKAQ